MGGTTRARLTLMALLASQSNVGAVPLDYPDQYFYDDNEQLLRKEKDSNQDGKIDLWEHYAGSPQPVRIEFDENFDGDVDLWQFFLGPRMVRQEQDTDRNGKTLARVLRHPYRVQKCHRQDSNLQSFSESPPYFSKASSHGFSQLSHVSFNDGNRFICFSVFQFRHTGCVKNSRRRWGAARAEGAG